MSSSYYTEQKTLKQVAPITYTLETKFFAGSTYEGLWLVFFKVKKLNILVISRKEKTKQILFVRSMFSFLCVNF